MVAAVGNIHRVCTSGRETWFSTRWKSDGNAMAFWVNVSAMVALIPMVLLNQKLATSSNAQAWQDISDEMEGRAGDSADGFGVAIPVFNWLFLGVDHGAATLMTVVGRASVLVYIHFLFMCSQNVAWIVGTSS
jgi:hypothetical protein